MLIKGLGIGPVHNLSWQSDNEYTVILRGSCVHESYISWKCFFPLFLTVWDCFFKFPKHDGYDPTLMVVIVRVKSSLFSCNHKRCCSTMLIKSTKYSAITDRLWGFDFFSDEICDSILWKEDKNKHFKWTQLSWSCPKSFQPLQECHAISWTSSRALARCDHLHTWISKTWGPGLKHVFFSLMLKCGVNASHQTAQAGKLQSQYSISSGFSTAGTESTKYLWIFRVVVSRSGFTRCFVLRKHNLSRNRLKEPQRNFISGKKNRVKPLDKQSEPQFLSSLFHSSS